MRAPRRVTGCETEAAEPSRGRRRRRPLQSVVTLLTGVRGRSAEGRIVPVMGLHPQVEEVGGGGGGKRSRAEEGGGGGAWRWEGRGDNTSRTFSRDLQQRGEDGWRDAWMEREEEEGREVLRGEEELDSLVYQQQSQSRCGPTDTRPGPGPSSPQSPSAPPRKET